MTQQPPMQQGQPGAARPGQMTAVMRAVQASGPKVLRIGVVHAGRVTEERIIKQRSHVTVGPNEKSMFVLATQNVPANFRLFELIGNEYWLNFLDGMHGRVALPSGVSDLSVLKGQARRTPQGAYQVKLTEDSRGKVQVGDVTFLFQFVTPPPVQPRPQLPVSVTSGASAIDWTTTMIVAFCLLAHTMLAAAAYSDWFDQVVDEDTAVAGLIESMSRLPAPPPVEDKPTEEDITDAKATDKPTDEPKKATNAGGKAAGAGANAGAGKAGGLSDKQAAALASELDRLEMATLGAMSSSGPATAGVLRTGESVGGALDKAAAQNTGVSGGSDLKLGGGGGPLKPGETGTAGLGSLGSAGKGDTSGGTGTVSKPKGPTGSASVGGASVSGGSVSNASRVVAGMRAGFRSCYQRGLAENPDAQGSIRLTIRVGPNGEVQSVSASSSGSLPGSVVSCVRSRAQAAQFDPPEGGSASIAVPVSFVKQ